MKFTWIYILFCAVVVTNCVPTSERPPSTSEVAEENGEEEEHQETLEDLADLGAETTDLPILPPIILIDFTNGTNLTSEEKSKRTINGNLGYGFQSNNLFSGKYNYYFPAGKTGTTVSIEESISPFLPTTIIEKVNFVPEKQYSDPNANSYSTFVQNNLYGSNSNGHGQSQIGANAPLVFGQRTKLQKATANNFQSFSRPTQTQNLNYVSYTTPKPNFRPNQFSSGSGLASYNNPSSTYEGFSTARPTYSVPLQGRYNSYSGSNFKTYENPLQSFGGISTTSSPPTNKPLSSRLNLASYSQQPSGGLQSYSTPKPQTYSPSQSQTTVLSPLGNTPKFSYMDGIKYEHKIVWKYPNGMVSEIGPNSYDSTYQEYSSPTKVSLTSNYQNPGLGNNFPQPLNSGYSVDAGAIYSQKPATFPDAGPSTNDDSKPNQFVSSASISSGGEYFSGSAPGASQPAAPSQKYSFQDPYALQSNGQSAKSQTSASSASTTSYKTFGKSNLDDPKVISSYPVNSPEAEYPSLGSYSSGQDFAGPDGAQASPYTFSQSSPIPDAYSQLSSLSSDTSGKIQPTVLSKYTPQAQQYLKKALGLGESGQSQKYETSSPAAESYSNIQYSNLLNYNPSISQYISDPSSILNAQPTFVQAGNSLIPVIILRVDGAAPIQPKVTPNINLKALLQKYLTQYAQTVSNLAQGKSFDRNYGSSAGSSSSKLFDIAQLAQSLSQLDPGSNFKQNFAQNFAQSIAQDYQPSSFSGLDSHAAKYSSPSPRETTRKPKVKNVEIIDDPRFTSYKVKN